MTKTATMTTTTKRVLVGIVVALVIALGSFFALYKVNTQGVTKNSETVLFEVKQGESFQTTLDRLESEGIIRSAYFTKIESKISKKNQTFHGTFELDKSLSSKEILTRLADPDFSKDTTNNVTVTLVEGIWAKDIAKEIAAVTNTKAERFLELWNNNEFIESLMKDYEVIPASVLKLDNVRVKLEGYLYPDTYNLKKDASEEDITRELIKNGNDKFQQYKNDLKKLDMSQEEIMTLASIVEYEASTDEDMKLVAGVFLNRLKQNMKLQSSVTVCYSLYEFDSWTECESAKNNQHDTVYNTYVYEGLPPGPILNPSLKAITAVLNYTPSDYIFFIADVNNVKDGKVYYQVTYQEHEAVRKELLGY
ncbi:MAG: endolytic transglycosylase MltG [Erysipelothrix sp.]